MKKTIVIGSGFAGISAACYLARGGCRVTVVGDGFDNGCTESWRHDGFTFDKVPEVYRMPDIFEQFFSDMGYAVDDLYDLQRLDPGYEAIFPGGDRLGVPGGAYNAALHFEKTERGSGKELLRIIARGAQEYRMAMESLTHPCSIPPRLITISGAESRHFAPTGVFMQPRSRYPRRITDLRLRRMLQFPDSSFVGRPCGLPAFYPSMTYADIVLGIWHPIGGMVAVAAAALSVGRQSGVELCTGGSAERITVSGGKVSGVDTASGHIEADAIVTTAGYGQHEGLLPPEYRGHSATVRFGRGEQASIYHVGFDRRIPHLSHHTIFYDTYSNTLPDSKRGARDTIVPAFYLAIPSATDCTAAPQGCEAATVILPPGPWSTEEGASGRRFRQAIERVEDAAGAELFDHILFCKESKLNGNISLHYGPRRTGAPDGLSRRRHHKGFHPLLPNIFHAGHIDLPGAHVPSALLSGKIAAGQVLEYLSVRR